MEGDPMSQSLPNWVQSAACYLRRSREDLEAERRGENTLLAQRELMVREVLPHYPVSYQIYEEVASGDTIKDRPVFQQLLADLERGLYQAIAVKDLTRLGRGSYSDMGKVYDLIRDKRIFIINSTSVLDPDNPDDLRNLRFSMFLSREEYESILFRLVQGKYNQVRHRGAWVAGVTPYGYDYNRDTRKLTPNEHADKVRLIYQLFVQDNLSPQAISHRLRQLGIESPMGKEHWNPQTIRRLLQNPVYKGTVRYKRTKRLKSDGKVVLRPKEEQIIVDRAHPPIVNLTLWNLAQEKIDRGQPKNPVDFTPTELASIITCASCGRKMLRQSTKQVYRRKNGEDSVYEKEFLACIPCGYWVQYRLVEQQLMCFLQTLPELSGDTLQRQFENTKQTQEHLSADKQSLLTSLYQHQRLILNRLEKSRDFLVDGTFTRTEFESDRARHQAELDKVMEAISKLEDESEKEASVKSTANVPLLLENLTSLAKTYQQLDSTARKNALLRGVLDRVELVFLGKRGRQNRFELNVSLCYEISL